MTSLIESIVHFLVEDPLLLLFVVCAIGYPLGRLRIAGNSLGVAAVLFVGLALFTSPRINYLLFRRWGWIRDPGAGASDPKVS